MNSSSRNSQCFQHPTAETAVIISFDTHDTYLLYIKHIKNVPSLKSVHHTEGGNPMKDKLRYNEQHFRSFVENSPDIVVLMNLEGIITYINPAVEKVLGFKPEERIGARGFERIHQDDNKFLTESFNTLATNTNTPVIRGEVRLRHKDGSWRTLEAVGKNLINNNVVEAIVVNYRDITERKKAEEKLQKSEENYRQLFDNSPVAIYQFDYKKGKIIKANDLICEYLGLSQEEITSLNPYDLLTQESKKRLLERMEKISQDVKVPETVEYEVFDKKGKQWILQLHIKNIYDAEGHMVASDVVAHDITERKQIEEALRKSEENFRRSLDDSPLGVRISTIEGETIYANRAILDIYGYDSIEELKQKPLKERYTPQSYAEFQARKKKRLQGDSVPSEYEINIVRKNGEIRHLHVFRKEIFWNGEKQSLVIYQDITSRKQAEESALNAEKSLKKSEERYRSVFENAGLPTLIMEDSLLIFMVNDRFVEMSGYRKDEIEGLMKFTDFICSGDRSALMRCLTRRRGDKPAEYECQILHCNGNKFDVLIRVGKIPEAGQYIVSFTDITSRKQAEIALLESQEHLKKENIRLRSSIRERYRFRDIIGKSRVMQEVYEFILQAAATTANVVIYGESGTGKELVAKAIHETSDRSQNKFVTVNCGAITETLMESEFFGYVKGSFTGANIDKPGYLDEADGGTLFLDEIGEIGLNMQVKLLRAIAGDGYVPVGGNTIKKSNVRIIAATNRNLRDLVKMGVMREDFFYRIHILPIYLPALRERKEDLPLLIDHFLQLQDKNHLPLPGHLNEALVKYNWPGNIRELQNVLHRYLTLKILDIEGMPKTTTMLFEGESTKKGNPVITNFTLGASPFGQVQPVKNHDDMYLENSTMTVEIIERDRIISALSKHNWRRDRTASALGINRKTLFRKMKKFGLVHP